MHAAADETLSYWLAYDDTNPAGVHGTKGTAHRAVQLAVRRSLAGQWDEAQPRVAVVERDPDQTIVYVSTIEPLGYENRIDIRSAVHVALVPHTFGTPHPDVRFLTH